MSISGDRLPVKYWLDEDEVVGYVPATYPIREPKAELNVKVGVVLLLLGAVQTALEGLLYPKVNALAVVGIEYTFKLVEYKAVLTLTVIK
jgi:hypothetical protein